VSPKTSTNRALPDPALLRTCARVPEHVVYRSFPAETVVLNLQTGRYHGLNPTGGAMLEALDQAASVHDAAVALSDRYEQTLSTIERDLCELCQALRERGLIEIDGESLS
jgi:Coenzyme PQQ synthesis protein D (PqqD)